MIRLQVSYNSRLIVSSFLAHSLAFYCIALHQYAGNSAGFFSRERASEREGEASLLARADCLRLMLSPLPDTSWITAAAAAASVLHCSRRPGLNEHGMQNKATQDAIWPTENAESFYEQLRYVHDN